MTYELARVGRCPLGRTWAGGRCYGAVARCECGARFTSNEAPSKGGTKIVLNLHAAHQRAMGVEP